MKEKIKFVLKFAKPHKWKFIIMLVSIVLATITLMILPFIIGWLVDEVLNSQNMSRFIYIVSIYGVVYIFNQAMYTIVNIMEKVTSTAFLFDIRAELYSRILRFKGSCLASMYSGDTISRMGYDVDQIMTMISINLFGLVSNSINLVIALVFIYCANIWLGVFTTAATPIIIYVSRNFFRKAKRENSRIIKKRGILSSWTFEILGGMQEIKLLHASKQILSEFLRRNIEIARASIGLNRIEVKAERLNAGILVIAQMCMFTMAAFLVRAGKLTIGGVTACFAYYTNCITSFNSINARILFLSANLVSCDRIMELFDVPLEEVEHFNQREILKSNREQIAGSIEFKNVSFYYNEERNVFKDLSFYINPCEKIAIVGNSGVGKSTLVNLLCRIYDVNDGNILVDGKDIMEYDIKYLREQIGVVHQNSIIFNGSIRFNLQFAWDKFQDDLLWESLKMAGMYDFVSSLEDGLDTIVGAGGLNFSGGQKQRIAIARVFVKNSPIMIFDESTSALDSESEMTIKKSWELLGKNHTLLIIAHRLSTIINSDRIIVFEDGKIAGFGKHEELLETCETYHKLFREQYLKSMGRGDFLKGQSDRIKTLQKTFGLLGKKKVLLYRLLLLKSLDLLLGIVQPIFYYIFINNVIVKGRIRHLPIVIAGYISIFLLQTLLIKFTRMSYNTLFIKLKIELRVNVLRRYINMKADSYTKYSTGDLANRINSDIELFEIFLQKHVIDYFFSIAKILVISVILFAMNRTLTIIGFIVIPFSFWLVQIIGKKANRVSEERRKFEGEYESFLNNSFQNWADIKTNNLEICMETEFDKYRRILAKLIVKSQIYIALNWLFTAFKDYFVTRMNLYFVGGLLIIHKKLTVGILLTYMDYFIQLVDNITSAVNSILDFSVQQPNMERVFEILELEYNVKIRAANLEDKITFSNVSFRYNDSQEFIINSLNITIYPGEHIAIVGRSGCGKTTLANLLTGVYEPCGGEILIGNRRLSELSHESISSKIGIVSQFSQMLNLSIRENLLLANRHAGEEEMRNACEKANILSFIESLPAKFETNIGECGIKLSGGQRQRLSIARLLLQNPDIIIFDESTSSLDSHSENEILKTIRLLSGSKTIITIAHRLSTVLISDRVALMENGKIVAIEGPTKMFTASEKFNELFAHQLNSVCNGRRPTQ